MHTERMVLTAARPTDAHVLMQLDSDPRVVRYITGGLPTSLVDARQRIDHADGLLFLAIDRSTSAMLGWFSIRRSSPTERELGYRLRHDVWGHGLATEGATAMIDLAFADPRVERVWAQTMTANTASRRVMERCGLRFVRTFFHDWPGGPIEGSEHGDVEYDLLRDVWSRPIGDRDAPDA